MSMDMSKYVAEIQHAATEVIKLVWSERQKLELLLPNIKRLTKEMEEGYSRVDFLALNPNLDDDNLSTAIYWDTYFGPDKDRHYALKDRAELESLVAARRFSTGAQSGSLLQYGKQGISIVYGDLNAAPPGRAVGSQALRDVVWQARNHALHWEDGSPRRLVEVCFDTLARDFGPQFSEYRTRTLAFDVVELLGWRSFEEFKKDMLTLTPKAGSWG
jgi:hypothetical protein